MRFFSNRKFRVSCARLTALLMVLALLTLFAPVMATDGTAYAATSWRPASAESSGSIYDPDEGSIGKDSSAIADVIDTVVEAGETVVGGVLGALLGPLIRAIGDAIYVVFARQGISIDSIVYGRVGGASRISNDVALFTFELSDHNIYGTVAMLLYNIFLTVSWILFTCAVLYKFTALVMSGWDSRSKATFKTTLQTALIALLAMFLMPKVLDLALYIRDVVLYFVAVKGTGAIISVANGAGAGLSVGPIDALYKCLGTGGEYSLITLYRNNAVSSLSITSSLMYLASTVLMIYFAFVYVSLALTMTVLVVMFPFICVMDVVGGGRRIGEWAHEMLGLMLIPVIDSVLLLIPVLFALLSTQGGVIAAPTALTLIQFILCASVIPARGYVRQKLGFGTASRMETAGLGAAMGAFRLGRSLLDTANRLKGLKKDANEEATREESLAQTNKAIIENRDRKSKEVLAENAALSESAEFDRIEGFGGFDNKAFEEDLDKAGTENHGERISRRRKELDNRLSRINDTRNAVKTRKDEVDDKISNLDSAIAYENSLLSERKASGDDEAATSGIMRGIAEKEAQRNELARQSRTLSGQIRSLDELEKKTNSAVTTLRAIGGDTDDSDTSVLDQMANVDNFELPEFRDISLDTRARLQAERAAKLRRDAAMQAKLGYIGASAGTLLGAGGVSFLGPNAMLYGAAIGNMAGAEAGMAIPEGIENARENVSNFVQKIDKNQVIRRLLTFNTRYEDETVQGSTQDTSAFDNMRQDAYMNEPKLSPRPQTQYAEKEIDGNRAEPDELAKASLQSARLHFPQKVENMSGAAFDDAIEAARQEIRNCNKSMERLTATQIHDRALAAATERYGQSYARQFVDAGLVSPEVRDAIARPETGLNREDFTDKRLRSYLESYIVNRTDDGSGSEVRNVLDRYLRAEGII